MPRKKDSWCLFIILALTTTVAGQQASPTAETARRSEFFDSAQLLRDLQILSADDMQGRQVGTAGGEKARAYVIERFKATGIAPFGLSYEVPFTFTSGRRGRSATERQGKNVIGHIDGSRTPRRYIVVSAHYDHIGVSGNGQVNNGADDNASGTAGLFAVARYFKIYAPANSLIFAAFDAEESGLRGAKAFVQQPPVEAAALSLNLNMDMIGRDPSDKLFVVGTALQPFLKPFIERLAAKAPVKLLMGHEDPKEREDWTRDSDHYAFMEVKIPALYFGVEDFDQHHRSTDDYETMTKDFYIRAVETMILAVKEFDANLTAVDKGRAEVVK